MSTNGKATSVVVDNTGRTVTVPDLTVPQERIFNFVEMNRKEYFEDHSIEWCLDEIINRGIAEIKRQVKTAAKTRENKAAGSLLKEFNLSPADAKRLLLELAAAKAAKA